MPRLRFCIHDLLLLMVVVALVIFGMQRINQQYTIGQWLAFSAWGALLAGIAGLAYGCTVSRWRLVYFPLLILLIPLTARVAPSICGRFFAKWFIECLAFGQARSWSDVQKVFALEIVYWEMAALIVAFTVLVTFSARPVPAWPRWLSTRAARAAIVVSGLLPFAWLYWQMLCLTPIPPPFSNGPTNYDRIAMIVSRVDPQAWWGTPIPPVAIVKRPPVKIAGDFDQLLAELLLLVEADNYIPFRFDDRVLKEHEIKTVWPYGDHFGSCAMAIDAEAAKLSDQDECARAAELALVNIRLGTMLRRGGTLWHDTMGQYCESYGYQRLVLIRHELSPEAITAALAILRRAADEPEPLSKLRARDQAHEERAAGWMQRLRNVFSDLKHREHWNPHQEIQAFNALLQAELAIRQFQQEIGRLPENLRELAPRFLPTLPPDPYAQTGEALRYRLDGDAYVLYSVGVFGQDNGGTFGNRVDGLHRSDHDIDIETWTRP